MRYLRTLLTLALLCLSLSACILFKFSEKPMYKPWVLRKTELQSVSAWKLKSVITIWHDDEVTSFSFKWQQKKSRYALLVSMPFTTGKVLLRGDRQRSVKLFVNGQFKMEAVNPEELTSIYLGWRLPISLLHDWIRGVPALGDVSDRKLDEYGRLVAFQQAGWKVRYDTFLRYRNKELPEKIILEGEGLKIKIVNERWQF